VSPDLLGIDVPSHASRTDAVRPEAGLRVLLHLAHLTG
jgi:hypothetical protein